MSEAKRKNLRRNLVILVIYLGLLVFWVIMGWPCVIRWVTGVPCPGCGLSRACLAVLRLDFGAAFRYHPMFWSFPLLLLYALFDGQLFRRKWLNIGLLSLILSGMAVCYVIRLVVFLNGNLTI